MRTAWAYLAFVGLFVTPAVAQPDFTDDFEPSGVDQGIWSKWPEADEIPFSDCNPDNNHTDDVLASCSARVEEADPWGYAMYTDFGATAGPVYAEVYIKDPLDDDGTNYDRPVSICLTLVGEAFNPAEWTDYQQLGVVAYWSPDGLTQRYGFRTRYHDDLSLGPVMTNVPRKQGWTKLAIAADALADGGHVRFFIDDLLVGESYRRSVNLQFIRLGINYKSYDYIWYDDVLVSDVLPPVTDMVRFDVDDDGDVDQDDFGAFQACYSGAGAMAPTSFNCWRMDADGDLDVDVQDLDAFELCASGPAIPADTTCDDG